MPGTGVKGGAIEAAIGAHRDSDDDHVMLTATAKSSRDTGAPIMIHTDDGKLGDRRQSVFTALCESAHRIIAGDCCGTGTCDHHVRIAGGGLHALVSHDSVSCWCRAIDALTRNNPRRFLAGEVLPELRHGTLSHQKAHNFSMRTGLSL